jgi:hypothetical protein
MGAVALLGWRAVQTLDEQRCSAQETTFTRSLQDAIENNLVRGKTRTALFTLPCEADEVCFVPRPIVDNYASGSTTTSLPPSIANSIVSGEQTNVFVRRNGLYDPVSAFAIAAPIGGDDIVCFAGDSVEIRFQGTGQEVMVGAPQ